MRASLRLGLATALSLAAPALVFVALALVATAPRDAAGFPEAGALGAAGLLMASAGVVDWIDGGVARRLGVSGSFGRFVDLYCDATASSAPTALIMAMLPQRLGGAALPQWPAIAVGALFVAAVVLRHAIVSERQTAGAVTRERAFRGLVTPPYIHLVAGWLLALGSGAEVPLTGLGVAEALRANTVVLLALFAAGAALINTGLPYIRAGELALRSPWPWWIALGAVASTDLGLALVAMQIFYIATPLWLRLRLLRETPYRLPRPGRAA